MKEKDSLCCWLLLTYGAMVQPQALRIQDQPDDGQWTMRAKNYASTRFSTLTEVNIGAVRV